ncbi:hypothetical protein EVAR_45681_1 [Eumeta japonica]|uniref:PDZ domain-containing protein n=1 Tax=Eumeta variegata TaxID=151549 RepID=A0A4C1XHU7_EUMVA|nr:hypothetical protein EVAR_45681_1 [Eumeta japonica]
MADERLVVLNRSDNLGFGFSLLGEAGLPHIIYEIEENSPAARSGQHIVPGEEIWIYCYDPKTKQQSTIWFYRDEPKPTKVAREQSASNRMIATLFNKTGYMATVALENC